MPATPDSAELARLLREAFAAGRRPFPELADPERRRRWRDLTEADGSLERLRAELARDAETPAPALSFSVTQDFRRFETRRRHAAFQENRHSRIRRLLAGVYLGLDVGEMIDDLPWSVCETTHWWIPAHRFTEPLDLLAAMTAYEMAMLLAVCGDGMDWRVRRRVLDELERRVWAPFCGRDFHWMGWDTNWNAVCHGGILLSALLAGDDPARVADMVTESLPRLRVFLGGFTEDGGCTEGPGYWRFGWSWYMLLARGLRDATGGALDLMAWDQPEKIAAICRYPLFVTLGNGRVAAFADGGPQFYPQPWIMELAGQTGGAPQLRGLAELDRDGRVVDRSLETMLFTDPGFQTHPLRADSDNRLAGLGIARLVRGDWAAVIKAGHNDEIHNHNDIGSFVLSRAGVDVLTDPGAPVYSKRTFDARRYGSLFCGAQGHSVPTIGGVRQQAGARWRGALEFTPAPPDRDAAATVHLASAYDLPALKRFDRRLAISADGRQVILEDDFAMDGPPLPVREQFMTRLKPQIAADGAAVRLQTADGSRMFTLAARVPGQFSAAHPAEEIGDEDRQAETLYRIVFTPAESAAALRLSFTVEQD